VIEWTAGFATTRAAVAEPAHGQRLRSIACQSGDDLLQQWSEPLSLPTAERGEQRREDLRAPLEELVEDAASVGRQVERMGAAIASGPPLEEAVVDEPLDDLHGSGL
jgi:hypothetical protein